MEKQTQKINIDEILVVVEEVIPDTPPKTRFGRWLRWLKKAIQIKTMLGISINKKPVN